MSDKKRDIDDILSNIGEGFMMVFAVIIAITAIFFVGAFFIWAFGYYLALFIPGAMICYLLGVGVHTKSIKEFKETIRGDFKWLKRKKK